MPGQRILCVAEKNSIAKAVASHLSDGQMRTHSIVGTQFTKNYDFQYHFPAWGMCNVTMTSVSGHLTGIDFEQQYKGWKSCAPSSLFEAPLVETVAADMKAVANNIQQQAQYSRILFVWTDCDREGEHIGTEVRSQALKGNNRIQVKRAKFSNTEKQHIIQAALNPIDIDDRQADAVAARRELDLRIGAAFTRLQTLQLQTLDEKLSKITISYGSCQFPTLGFVVDRYHAVRNFKPETFWLLRVTHVRERIKINFNWKRVHLFDRAAVTIIFEQCLDAEHARVSRVQKKPTSKWRPLPLTTVELQMQGSRFLRMNSSEVMKVAEDLYNKGFISYPRTETNIFPNNFDLQTLIQRQTQDSNWGQYAQRLINGDFRQPRAGRENDQAHPPIHPVNYAAHNALNPKEKKVYEFVVRRYLACCSDDARGEATDVEIKWGNEIFHTHGLIVLERNYLDVYIYDKWESSQQLPQFTLGESFKPTEAHMTDGKTTSPSYLTEPELIGLMDANGIGTDATMAEHIEKIKERSYVQTRPKPGGAQMIEFIPTYLGVALVEGYDNVGLDVNVSKPFLRKEMELQMKEICGGRKSRMEVVQETINQYRDAFTRTQMEMQALKRAVIKYVVNGETR